MKNIDLRLNSVPDDSYESSKPDHDFRTPHAERTSAPRWETDMVDCPHPLERSVNISHLAQEGLTAAATPTRLVRIHPRAETPRA